MRILVTGGSGFIGRHLLFQLKKEKKNEICLLLRSNHSMPEDDLYEDIHIIKGDLIDLQSREEITKFNPELVYHLAWNGIPDYSLANSIENLFDNIDFIDFLGKIKVKKLVVTGSCWEYGRNQGKLDESLNLIPNNPFTVAKSSILEMGKQISEKYGFIFIWARLFYVYGPGQSEHSLLPSLINMAKNGKKPEAKSPFAQNDFIYVKDVVNILIAMSEEDFVSGTFNVASGKTVSVDKIVKIISEKFGYDHKLKNKYGNENEHPNFYGDISKLQEIYTFSPTPIENGLEKTISLSL